MQSLLYKLGLCILLLLCLLYYGQTHFYRDPGSIFFDKSRAYEQRYSKHRIAQVYEFIEELEVKGQPKSERQKAGTNARLCLSISTVNRNGSTYLETTIGSLLHGLTAAERAELYINVLVAESFPDVHPSWRATWLRENVDRFESYSFSSAAEEDNTRKLQEQGAYAEKGVYDYVTALQRCLETGIPYIGVFEDDVLLAYGWKRQTLAGVEKISRDTVDGDGHWLFMRLFNQERSIGWASKRIGGNHEGRIILGIVSGISLVVTLLRRYFWWAYRHISLETLLVVNAVLVPSLVVLFFQCGKASLLPPAPGIYDQPYGCCSQAMVFLATEVPAIIEYMQEQKKGQIDLLLDEYASEAGLARYALYPVQAQHIGLRSARMTERDEAQAIWSMAFEDLNPGDPGA